MFQLVPNIIIDSVCIMAVVMVALHNYYCMRQNQRGTGYMFFIVFILLFSLFYRPESGDFWTYLNMYKLGADYPYHHMEGFYVWLMSIIPNNFVLWRVCIWLPAAIIIVIIFKLLKIPSSHATTLFLVFALTPSYYYTRNVLALSVLYLAMVFFSLKRNTVKTFRNAILVVFLTALSLYLHKSMPMYILFAAIAIIIPVNKKIPLYALTAFPVLYGLVYVIASDFLNIAEIWVDTSTGENYLEDENNVLLNWKGVVVLIVQYLPFFYFFYVAFSKPVPAESSDFRSFKFFLTFSFITIFVSFLFWGQSAASLQGRIYKSSMIPFVYTVSIYFKHYFRTKQCETFIFLVCFNLVFSLFLSIVTSV